MAGSKQQPNAGPRLHAAQERVHDKQEFPGLASVPSEPSSSWLVFLTSLDSPLAGLDNDIARRRVAFLGSLGPNSAPS
ncbi:hypothetical protein FIBSPDRAFT_876249, partial [Athelia psychrophila]